MNEHTSIPGEHTVINSMHVRTINTGSLHQCIRRMQDELFQFAIAYDTAIIQKLQGMRTCSRAFLLFILLLLRVPGISQPGAHKISGSTHLLRCCEIVLRTIIHSLLSSCHWPSWQLFGKKALHSSSPTSVDYDVFHIVQTGEQCPNNHYMNKLRMHIIRTRYEGHT